MPGSILFVSAAILLVVTKSPDIYTVLAVVACTIIAGLSLTKYLNWSMLGSSVLIALSISLQSLLSYRCIDCIKADILIMAGTIFYAVIVDGKLKNPLRVMTAIMAILMSLNIALHQPSLVLNEAEAFPGETLVRYVKATVDGKEVTLDTQVKPVLFFSPTCGACKETVDELMKLDPEGKTWLPVLADGDLKDGSDYLSQAGYRGILYQHKWDGPVPTLLTARNGDSRQIQGVEGIIEAVGGGDN